MAAPSTALAAHETEPMTRKRVTAAQMVADWQTTAKRFGQSRSRIRTCHLTRHFLNAVSIDPDWQTEVDQDEILVQLPERSEIEQSIINDLSDFWPVYSRQPVGTPNPTNRRLAEACEKWLAGCDEAMVDHETAWTKGAEDGEFGYVLMPDLADFGVAPSFSEEITEKDYRALDMRSRFDYTKSRDGKATYKRPRKRYWRDDNGHATDDMSTRHEGETRKAYESEVDSQCHGLPWVERMISATDCVPRLTRGRGKRRYECTGLLVRTLYDVDELHSARWRWMDMGNRELIPRGFDRADTRGANGQVYVYEDYFYDDVEQPDGTIERHPCVAYCVAGKGTARGNQPLEQDGAVVIDLKEEFGLETLMVGYFWFMRSAADDPDFIGRPLLWSLVPTIINMEKVGTAINAFTVDNGYAGYVMPLPENMSDVDRAAFIENGQPVPYRRPKPGEIIAGPGAPIPVSNATASPDAHSMLAFHADRLQRSKPTTAGEQQQGASGNSMLVADDLTQRAHRQLREGIRQLHEWLGSCRLQLAHAMYKRFDVKVPVPTNLEQTTDGSTASRGMLEFDVRWLGPEDRPVYDVRSKFPAVGNLAEAQQYADFYERGLVLWEEFREKLGDEDPASSRIKQRIDAYFNSSFGMARLDIFAANIVGDEEEKARVQAQLDQLLTEAGVPTGAIAPDEAAGPPPGMMPPNGTQMPGLGLPNIAASTVGGTIAGQVGQAAAMAQAGQQAAVPGGR